MRRTLVLLAAVLGALLSFGLIASSARAGENPTVSGQTTAVAPSPLWKTGISYEGKWKENFRDASFLIKEIKGNQAAMIYFWGRSGTDSSRTVGGASQEGTGVFLNPETLQMQLESSGGKNEVCVTFELKDADMVWGRWGPRGTPGKLHGEFKPKK